MGLIQCYTYIVSLDRGINTMLQYNVSIDRRLLQSFTHIVLLDHRINAMLQSYSYQTTLNDHWILRNVLFSK